MNIPLICPENCDRRKITALVGVISPINTNEIVTTGLISTLLNISNVEYMAKPKAKATYKTKQNNTKPKTYQKC